MQENTYVDLGKILQERTEGHTLLPLSQQGDEKEVTFILFRRQIDLLRQVQDEMLDPKSMMDAILAIKEGVAAEYDRYRRADKNPAFRRELVNEVSQMTEE